MAVTLAKKTRNALSIATGKPATVEDLRDVIEQQNWNAGNVTDVLFAWNAGQDNWDGNNELGPHKVVAETSAGATDFYRGIVYIDEDHLTLTIGSEMDMPASNTVDFDFTINAATYTNTHTDAENGSLETTSIDVSGFAEGWYEFEIALDHTSGSSNACELLYVTLQGITHVAGSLQSPEDS